ncbi:alanyl-tRNA editing protein [Candidatus Bathyarchaeota archaeon]|nr:alanyl-tRNA editing protein [Candidatus Bathyarchaeota archaeon]
MTKELFLVDSYLKESKATITSVKNGKYVTLNQTIFYPKGGGQPHDTGELIKDNETYKVVYVGKFSGEISHEVDHDGLQVGDEVYCVLNWARRYKLMRSHTAAHVLASLLNQGTGALITGNQLEEDRVRFDFNLKHFDREILENYLAKSNMLFDTDVPVKWYELPKDEAMKIPGVVKVSGAFPPDLPVLRIVEIVGVDKQADGGTHVRTLREIGKVELIKTENKGKNNRRIYFKLN